LQVYLSKKYDILILMLHKGHLTTWLLLLTKWIHRKKIVLWGHGISVKRYLKEEVNPDPLLKWMGVLADMLWVYTEKEKKIWLRYISSRKIVALNNTFSGVEEVLSVPIPDTACKNELKKQYGITQDVIFIFCARFTQFRRNDLLIRAIEVLDSNKYGFIIIGDGKYKPEFYRYHNVFDFGMVYSRSLKNHLFAMADIYYQPAWCGLSIVEAMAYEKPVFTFRRSDDVLQCVEYGYIKHGVNGFIFSSFEDFINTMSSIDIDTIRTMGKQARDFVHRELRMDIMVGRAVESLMSLRQVRGEQ